MLLHILRVLIYLSLPCIQFYYYHVNIMKHDESYRIFYPKVVYAMIFLGVVLNFFK